MLIAVLLWALACAPYPPQANTPPRLEFEVASVKPSKPGAFGGGIKPMPSGQGYIATNVSVKLMIELMYHLNDRQVSGGPGWLNTDLFDIEAKADGPHNVDDLHTMFQNLLVDRFNLKFHKETRKLPAYELVVDKSGPKLKENSSPETFDIPIRGTGPGRIEATHCSMSYFAWNLSLRLDQPVIDQTGLAKFYDFKLEWTPEPPPGAPGGGTDAGLPSGPDLFTALRQQLGLKLDSHKGPVVVMVIDHIEKPSEN